jgi:hypothetical protein
MFDSTPRAHCSSPVPYQEPKGSPDLLISCSVFTQAFGWTRAIGNIYNPINGFRRVLGTTAWWLSLENPEAP